MSSLALWLADYHLLAVALLLGVTIASALLRQPAQRMALANATLASLAALALLSALPGWSLVHLMSEPAPAAPVAPSLASSLPVNFPAPPRFEMLSHAPPTAAVTPLIHGPISPPVSATPAVPVNWLAVALALYASGSAGVLIWLIIGATLAHRVRRQATPAPPELQEFLRQVCGAEKTSPELLLSPRVAAPAALGLRRPAIILPAPPASADLTPHSPFPIPPARLLPILAHEWAHLQHRDLHTLAASRLLLVLLWPQPLFWLLRRTIRLDQEILADAAAADRAGRLDYAQQLLAWARTANTPRPPRLAGAVGLWEGPSQLKRRIALLLNEQFNVMRSCSRRWRGGSLAALALLAIGLSTITLQPRAGVASDAQDERADVESPTTATSALVAQPSTPNVAPAPPLPKSTRISGRFVTEDGAQAEVRGQLEYVSTRVGLTSMGTAGQYTGTFNIEAPSGDIWLLYLTEEFAPATVGPLRADGTPIDNVEVKLTPGFSVPIEVVNEQGQPVAGATISALAKVSNGSIGTPVERTTDSQGRYLFRHVATLPYTIEVKARNYEPVRVDSVEFQPDMPVRYTLVPAKPTTGVIVNADGPVAGALLRFRAEVRPGHSTGGGTPYGDVVATADAQGRFALDGLATGSSYLYIAETVDGARDWSPAITAGEKDVVIRVHPRRDLRFRVVGDIDKFPKRNGKPYVSVRQRHEFKTDQGNYGDLVGEEVFITLTADGGEFTYQGLLPGEVELAAGEFKTTVAVNEQGVTDAALQVAPLNAVLNPAAAIPAEVFVDPTARYEEAGPAEPNVYAGLCVDEQGQPLAGVDVSLFVYENFEYANLPTENVEPAAVTKTDAAGRFRFENVAALAQDRVADAVSKEVAVIAQAPGCAIGGSLEGIDLIRSRGKTSRLPLVPAASFSGRVTDVSGHPIADAVVATAWGHLIPNAGLLTRTDAEGRYQLDSMPPATPVVPASVIVTHPDYVAKFAKHSSNSTNFDVQLRRGTVITGRVVYKSPDRNVEPVSVAGVRVWAVGELKENPGDEADGKRIAVTDADGRYELRGLVGGKYYLNASAPDRVTLGLADIQLLPQSLAVQPERIEVPDLTLTDGAIVRVKLIDAATGKPLAAAAGRNAFITPTRKADLPIPYAQRFPCPVDEQAETELRLPPGLYEFFSIIPATSTGYAWTTVSTEDIASGDDAETLKLAEGDVAEVTMAMEPYFPPKVFTPGSVPQPSLDLQIPSLSPYYAPQPAGVGATVYPVPLGAVPAAPPATTPPAAPAYVATQPIRPAELSAHAAPLAASAPGDAIMLARGIRPRLDAAEPNTIQGSCLDEQNQPLAGVALDLYRSDPSGSAPQTLVASTKTNAQGEYRFDDVVDIAQTYPNGRIPTAPRPGGPMLMWVARQPGRVSRESAAMENFVASRGQTVDLLMPAAASLTGVVRNAAGQPIEGALIVRRGRMAIASDFATARSDADGKFAVNDLPPFDMQTAAERQRAQNLQAGFLPVTDGVTATLMFSAGAQMFTATHPDYQFKNLPLTDIPAEIEVVLEPAARIAGRVVLPDGAPAAGVNVLVQNSLPKRGDWGMIDYEQYKQEREYEAYATTDADGRFELPSLQPGKFDLWVEAPGWLNAGQGDVEVAAGETTNVPDLKLTKGGTIKVQALYAATKEPLNHIAGAHAVAHVSMKDQIGRQHPAEQRVPLAADGTFTLASLPGTALVRLEAIAIDDDVRWLPASNEYKDLVIVEVKAGEKVEAKLPVKEVAPAAEIYKPVQPQGQSTADAALQMVPAVAPAGSPVPVTAGAQLPPAAAPVSAAIETRHQSVGMAKVVAVPLEPTDPSTENANKLAVTVVDEQNAPLAGVEALIYRVSRQDGEAVLERTLTTDAAGKVVVDGLVSPAEVERFKKVKAEGGFLYDGSKGGYEIALRRAGLATALTFQSPGDLAIYGANRTIKMRPAVKLTGRVTDPAGNPVAGARVIAGGVFLSSLGIDGVNATTTDAEGRYEFADRAAFKRAEANEQRDDFTAASLSTYELPQGAHPVAPEDPSVHEVSNLMVLYPGFAAERIEGGDVPGVTDIQLAPSASITGRVVQHGSGAPSAGVTVRASGHLQRK